MAAKVPWVPPGTQSTSSSRGQEWKSQWGTKVMQESLVTGSVVAATRRTGSPRRAFSMWCGPHHVERGKAGIDQEGDSLLAGVEGGHDGVPACRKGRKDSSFSEEKEAKRLLSFAHGKNWQSGAIAIDRGGVVCDAKGTVDLRIPPMP